MELKIVVSQDSFNSQEAYDIVYSNITFINLVREEGGLMEETVHPDAILSYYLDYYLAQYKNGNFSQIVWNTQADYEFFAIIADGLEKIGATQNLALLKKQLEVLNNIDETVLEAFCESDYFGTNPTRDLLKNDDFYNLEEDIVELNVKWLRNHPDLDVLSIEGMYQRAEALLDKKIER
ncbi:DMP19 family protein [Myroides odoratimimus]|uniref:DMP19 family protein n=1 Tax=Myroides odoratimimus TaxID=76832 RepID=UPI00217F4AF3|nr:DMP19 family protein [Myroides odoratimimus]MCS7472153.1 DMP19 family protein [Myroides odoratimimus]